MRASMGARLGRLEGARRHAIDGLVIIRRVIEADGTMADVVCCQSADGRFTWERGADEEPEDFERRVTEAASRLTRTGTLIFLPDNRRDKQ